VTATLPPNGVVAYGRSSLADVLPSCLAALRLPGEPNALELAPADCVVVLLIDGLGWEFLRENAERAPFLSSLTGRALTAGFPTTTATSLVSLGTGRAPGQHGIVGYTTRVEGRDEPVNWLTWRGAHSGREVSPALAPEAIQPALTCFDRAQLGGINATVVSAPAFRESGLTRAGLRGGQYVPAFTAADTATLVAAAARTRAGLIYCYNADLDLIGHVHGARSAAGLAQLELIDRGVQLLFDRLPGSARLLVTADHGMLDVPDAAKIDYDREPELREGVQMIAGEARARYLYTEPAELEAVRARWTQRLGEQVAVLTRAEAIDRGWFGPEVSPIARARIGDLIALAVDDVAIVRRRAESRAAGLVGHHGALSRTELLVPLLSS
jgi:predicted AlkP superfamily pyrophosphatase or phosphodiesterase